MATIVRIKIGWKPVTGKMMIHGKPILNADGSEKQLTGMKREYHSSYDPDKIEIVCWQGAHFKDDVINSGYKEFIIGVIHDNDAPQFLQDPNCIKINKNAAIALGNTWLPQIERIFDHNVVLGVLNKIRNKQQLTQEEEDAINPDSAQKGIHKSPSFTNRLEEVLVKDRFNG